jgi:aspartyl-tRNA synthetase
MDDLTPGYYFSISPCFRDNEEDEFHFTDFMKLELCIVGPSDESAVSRSLERMIQTCLGFFTKEFKGSTDCRYGVAPTAVRTKDGFDIEINGIEVGSYGFREVKVSGVIRRWVYGTGLAEPRFTQVVQRG